MMKVTGIFFKIGLALSIAILLSITRAEAQSASGKSKKPDDVQISSDNNAADQYQNVQKDTKSDGQKDLKKSEEKTVKKVKASNPDLSKSKGARPPTITRPSGNAIPRGAGKPAGVIRAGRR